MSVNKFIGKEIARLQKKIDEDREKYGYTGSPSTLKTIERNEDMVKCLEYALAFQSDKDEGYRVFTVNAKALKAYYTELNDRELELSEKWDLLGKRIETLTYWETK
jgi:hypothetical protein